MSFFYIIFSDEYLIKKKQINRLKDQYNKGCTSFYILSMLILEPDMIAIIVYPVKSSFLLNYSRPAKDNTPAGSIILP